MNIDDFWAVVDQIKDGSNRAEALKSELEKLEASELVDFQKHFDRLFEASYSWELWGAAYIINGGCSDDGFIDFRYGLISRGKAVYESAVKDPDSLAEFVSGPNEIDDELFGYVADEVYEDKSGNEMPREMNHPSEPSGESWDFDHVAENRARLPKVTNKFWQ